MTTTHTETAAPQLDGNPLLEGLRLRRRPDPCALVIFGASGDLTQRKLIPAVYSLAVRRLLPTSFGIVGVGRTALESEQWREQMRDAVQHHARDAYDRETWDWLAAGRALVGAQGHAGGI